ATQTAAWHTFVYGGAAALIALAVALAIAYVAHRRLVPFSSGLTYVAMAPFVIYGTAWILILAFATRFLPIAYANSDAAIRAINPELEAAVRILGGSRALALRRVVTRLFQRALPAAFFLVFFRAPRELSSPFSLFTPAP